MNHRWDPTALKITLPHESADGTERHKRSCLNCGIIKTTIIPPTVRREEAWAEYQFRENGPVSFERPDCVPERKRAELKEAGA